MSKKKRNWPDHTGIGRIIIFNGHEVTVVDVKCKPMMVDTSTFDQPEAIITSTLKLCLKYEGGHEAWTPPIDGQTFVNWCDKQDAIALATKPDLDTETTPEPVPNALDELVSAIDGLSVTLGSTIEANLERT